MAKRSKTAFDAALFLATVGVGVSSADYAPNRSVFSQGDLADALFYIQKGQVKLTTVSSQGKEAVVALLQVGDFFGEGCLAGQPVRISTATTISDSLLVRLDKAAVIRALEVEPAFAGRFMTHLLARNIRMEADIIDQLFNSSERRLARLLLLLANYGKEGELQPVLAKVSQETLAEMIGTTRSRVSYFMNKFRRLGFIE